MTIESDAARLRDFAERMVALHHDLHRHPAIRALCLRPRDGCHQRLVARAGRCPQRRLADIRIEHSDRLRNMTGHNTDCNLQLVLRNCSDGGAMQYLLVTRWQCPPR